ncbi:MAG TPA: IS110 family transposase [Gemmatimonadales bacterium]|nr:IS110 family transposase [Gemmatimonadales bacterium]
MEIVYRCCCGVDVHKTFVMACLRRAGQAPEIQRFGTMTADLEALAAWLAAARCEAVAMESTGVYWKPVYHVLEGTCALLLVNAQHLRMVPGRKTDVQDAEWIADLLAHGLLRGSVIPPAWQRELRDLTRFRATLVQERARLINRLQKILEDANLKLGDVATDVAGVSGRAILHAIAAGESDPARLADLAKGRLRAQRARLVAALTGRISAHHRFLLQEHLAHLEALDARVDRVSAAIAERTSPFDDLVALVDTIPGLNRRGTENLLAEIGTDMQRYVSAAHLASWAGMCPGQDESAGKRRSGRTRAGNRWLRHTLVEAAHGASFKRDSYLRAYVQRLRRRRGHKRALVALGHTLLVIVYHVLRTRTPYRDLGANYFDDHDRQHVQRALVRRLERLGYAVTLQTAA